MKLINKQIHYSASEVAWENNITLSKVIMILRCGLVPCKKIAGGFYIYEDDILKMKDFSQMNKKELLSLRIGENLYTLQEIGAELGVSTACIYNHMKNDIFPKSSLHMGKIKAYYYTETDKEKIRDYFSKTSGENGYTVAKLSEKLGIPIHLIYHHKKKADFPKPSIEVVNMRNYYTSEDAEKIKNYFDTRLRKMDKSHEGRVAEEKNSTKVR